MKRLLLILPLIAVLSSACQKPDAPLVPSYEGIYSLQITRETLIDYYRDHSTLKGTLTIVKNADGTYSFTEKLPNLGEFTYQATVTGKTFTLPMLTEPFYHNGVTYNSQSTGSGEFKTSNGVTNSVTINRTTTAFDAGSVRVSRTTTSYGYHG